MNLPAVLRAAVGTETTVESYAALVRMFKVTALACDRHNTLLDAETPGAQSDFSVQRACEDASAELCAEIKVPMFSAEAHGRAASMLRYSAECQLKNRHDLVLFTAAK